MTQSHTKSGISQKQIKIHVRCQNMSENHIFDQQNSKNRFQCISQIGNITGLFPENSQCIGRTRIAASIITNINTVTSSVNIAGLETSKEITDQQAQKNISYHFLFFLSLTDNEFQRCSPETESFSYFIFNISCIRKMGQFLVIDKNNKCGRFYSHLSNII